MKPSKIYVLGIGRSTPLFLELAKHCGYEIAGLYHYNNERTGQFDHGYEILGSFDDLLKKDLDNTNFLLSMGDNEVREQIFKKIIAKGGNIPSLIHKSAMISEYSQISDSGVLIGPFVEVQADVTIECNTMIRTGVVVCHGTSIGRNCFVGPKALIGAYTIVENNVFVGQGALSISGKVEKIGSYSLIGACSLVNKTVPENAVVLGSPARFIKQRFHVLPVC